jgi:hypothetical protein
MEFSRIRYENIQDRQHCCLGVNFMVGVSFRFLSAFKFCGFLDQEMNQFMILNSDSIPEKDNKIFSPVRV